MKALIVDDEKPARDRLRRLLAEHSDVQIIGEASDGLMALDFLEETKCDVVFLDIEMPELGGIEVARQLDAQGPTVVFTTAYDEYALQAFDANALDYVLKPVDPKRLSKALERLRQQITSRTSGLTQEKLSSLPQSLKSNRVAFKVGAKFKIFKKDEISCILSKDHYSAVIVDKGEILCDDSLDALEQKLDSAFFHRVHRNAIININFLKELKREGDRKYLAILDDHFQNEIPVSRERLQTLKSALGLD
ncbi:MAG: LytR/AlgR family response regulator transcription factor [Oligoflexales bacterium]